jgi:hypothetical protein
LCENIKNSFERMQKCIQAKNGYELNVPFTDIPEMPKIYHHAFSI